MKRGEHQKSRQGFKGKAAARKCKRAKHVKVLELVIIKRSKGSPGEDSGKAAYNNMKGAAGFRCGSQWLILFIRGCPYVRLFPCAYVASRLA